MRDSEFQQEFKDALSEVVLRQTEGNAKLLPEYGRSNASASSNHPDGPPPAEPDDYGVVAPDIENNSRLRFTPVAIDDVCLGQEPAWLIRGLLPARGLACIVGLPKCGKSFLTADMLFYVARGDPYAGREVLSGPVIYLTGERITGFKRRAVGMRRHYNVEGQGTPFFVVENVPIWAQRKQIWNSSSTS